FIGHLLDTNVARRTPDARLESRESRSRLASRGKPHYEPGLHIGYRRLKGRKARPAVAGTWIARHYVGRRKYVVEKIGTADDFSDADGTIILNFAQAQDKARSHMVSRARSANGIVGPLTVRAAVEFYLEFLEANGKSAVDARHRAKAHIYPTLGDFEVGSLTTLLLRKWLAQLAKALPRARTRPGKPQRHRAFDGSDEAIRRRKSSANRTWTILRAALNHAFREDLVASDTTWRKVKSFKGVDAARGIYLTVEQARRLVNATDSEFRLLVQAALQTGCRYSELARLERRLIRSAGRLHGETLTGYVAQTGRRGLLTRPSLLFCGTREHGWWNGQLSCPTGRSQHGIRTVHATG
ncbi:MAG: hypothetical protein WCD56_09405, partial [Pseudolabrys sp.]